MPPGISVPVRPSAFATASQSPSATATDIDRPAATTVLTAVSTKRFMARLHRSATDCPLCLEQRIHDQPRHGGKRNDRGLRNFLHFPKNKQRYRQDDDGRYIGDRALSEHDDGACDRADRRSRAAVDKRHDGWLLAVLAEIWRRDDGEEIARQERRQGRDRRAGKAGDQVADESDRDDHWPGRNHRHRYGVDELPLG